MSESLPSSWSRSLLAAFLFFAVPFGGPGEASQGQGRSAPAENANLAILLARAADASGDGVLSGEEWIAFLDGLGADADGALDRHRVKAAMLGLAAGLTPEEVDAALLDRGGRGARGSGSFLAQLLALLADTNEDGSVSPEERGAFVEAHRPADGGVISERVVLEWLRRAEAIPPKDRNAMTPGVILVTIDAGLDTDADGRITLTDLNALHRGLDANGDGSIDAGEQAAPTGGGRAIDDSRWAVTAEARLRPPLMPWQRNLDDALAVSRATGKPLLICVNMDGENASESLAWGRYRDPAFAELASGFVPLVVSPDRREPRERDDRGRRLPDRRFGRVVNSEHIDIEPIVFERYFGGTRVAPRHVGVSPEGDVLFDVYLVQDLAIVDAKLREFGVTTAPAADPGTLSEEELLASSDAAHRDELERRLVDAGERARARLVGLALSAVRPAQHPELLHLGLRDESAAVRREAVWALIRHVDRAPLDLLPLAFAEVRDEPDLRAALVAATRRATEQTADETRAQNAAFYLRVFTQLDRSSRSIDVETWHLALGLAGPRTEPDPTEADREATGALLEDLERAVERSPDDAQRWVLLAAARMRFARIQLAAGGDPSYFFQDAMVACDRALELAPDDGWALGYRAWASYMMSDPETAEALAARALPHLLREPSSALSLQVLNVFSTLRTQAIYAAISASEAWPEDAVPDALAAYEVLIAHPAAGEGHWSAYLALLGSLRAHARQADVVRRGLERFPTSTDLHAYLRLQVLRDVGARALEAAYENRPLTSALDDHGPAIDWFHGLATFAAAEQDVANRRPLAALAAYRRSRERFRRSVEAVPDFAASAAHYQCLALAGEARVLADGGRYEEAVESLVAAARVAPGSVDFSDGLGKSPSQTRRELARTLVRAGRGELADELRSRFSAGG